MVAKVRTRAEIEANNNSGKGISLHTIDQEYTSTSGSAAIIFFTDGSVMYRLNDSHNTKIAYKRVEMFEEDYPNWKKEFQIYNRA